MENNQDQSFEQSFKQSVATSIPQPQTQPITMPNQKKNHKKIIFFSVGITLSIILVVIGIIVQSNAGYITDDGRTEQDIQKEISALDSEIEKLEDAQSEIFENSGFSEEYYAASAKTGELVDRQAELEESIAKATPQSITQSGSLWLFIAAGIIALISLVILFLKI